MYKDKIYLGLKTFRVSNPPCSLTADLPAFAGIRGLALAVTTLDNYQLSSLYSCSVLSKITIINSRVKVSSSDERLRMPLVMVLS